MVRTTGAMEMNGAFSVVDVVIFVGEEDGLGGIDVITSNEETREGVEKE